MSEQEWRRAEREAQRDVTAHPERLGKHEGGLQRYLGGVLYTETRARRERAPAPAETAAEERGAAPPGPDRLVVVGVDDSAASFAAAEQAAIEADLRGWALRVVHVQHPARGGALLEARDRGATLLAEMASRARAPVDTPVTTELAIGSPAEVLVELSTKAGLVVVGSRGVGPLTGLVTGSVSTQVAAHASAPVLIVRIPSAPVGREYPPSVVVGVDGSVESQAAAAFAAEEALLRGVALTAIHAAPEIPTYEASRRPDPLTTGSLAPAVLRRTGLTVHRRSVDADAREALVEASTRAVAVVVGARGRGGVRGVRLGSTSQALIRNAHCPVFVVHTPAPAGSAAAAA